MARWWRSVDLFAWGFPRTLPSLARETEAFSQFISFYPIIQKQVARFQDSVGCLKNEWKLSLHQQEESTYRSTVETAALTTPGCPRSFMRFRTSRVEIAELKEDSWWKIHNTNPPASMKSIAKRSWSCFPPKSRTWALKKNCGDFQYSN